MAVQVFCQRFRSRQQMEQFQREAKKRRWSLNTYMIAAAEHFMVCPEAGELDKEKTDADQETRAEVSV